MGRYGAPRNLLTRTLTREQYYRDTEQALEAGQHHLDNARPVEQRGGFTIVAQFDSGCVACDRPIIKGTPISKRSGRWVHYVCESRNETDTVWAGP